MREPQAGRGPAASHPRPRGSEPAIPQLVPRDHTVGGGPESPTGQPPSLQLPGCRRHCPPPAPRPGKQPSPVFVNPAPGQAAVCNRPGPAPGRGGGSLSAGRGQRCRCRGQWCCRAREDRPFPRREPPGLQGSGQGVRPHPRPLAEKSSLWRRATSRPGRAGEPEHPASRRPDALFPPGILPCRRPATPSSRLKPAAYLSQVRAGGPCCHGPPPPLGGLGVLSLEHRGIAQRGRPSARPSPRPAPKGAPAVPGAQGEQP